MAKSSKLSSIDEYYKKTGYQRHKFFWQVLFTLFLLIGVFTSYIAVQQQQNIRSKAATSSYSINAACNSSNTLTVTWKKPADVNVWVSVTGPSTDSKGVRGSAVHSLLFSNRAKGTYTATLKSANQLVTWDTGTAVCSGGEGGTDLLPCSSPKRNSPALCMSGGGNCQWYICGSGSADDKCARKDATNVCGESGTKPVCGNGKCETGETKTNCSKDCGIEPPPGPGGGGGGTGGSNCRTEGQTCGQSAGGVFCCQNQGLSCNGPVGNSSGLPKTCKKTSGGGDDKKLCRDFSASETQCHNAKNTDGSSKKCKWGGATTKCVAGCFKVTSRSQCGGDCEWKTASGDQPAKCVLKQSVDPAACENLAKNQCDQRTQDCKWFLCGQGNTDDVCADKGKTNEEVCGGDEPPTIPPGERINVKFAMNLSFQGIVGQPTVANQMNVRVTLAGGGLQDPQVKQANFGVGNNGVWSGEVTFDNVPKGGGYYLLVKGPKHIQKRVCDLVPSESAPGTYSCFQGNIAIDSTTEEANLAAIKLLVGDLPNQDGIVDAYDTSLVRNIVARPIDERRAAENLALADLNLDGIVDSQDFSLVISALSVRSDEE